MLHTLLMRMLASGGARVRSPSGPGGPPKPLGKVQERRPVGQGKRDGGKKLAQIKGQWEDEMGPTNYSTTRKVNWQNYQWKL